MNTSNYFSSDYIENLLIQLNKLKDAIDYIEKEYKKLKSYIEQKIFTSNNYIKFRDTIGEYIKSANDIKNNKNQQEVEKLKEDLTNNFKKISDDYSNIYENDHVNNIYKYIKNLNNTISNIIICFDPNDINNNNSNEKMNSKSGSTQLNTTYYSIENSINQLYQEVSNFCDEKNKDNDNIIISNVTIKSPFKCKDCNKSNAIYYCKHCIDYYCEEHYNKYKEYELEVNHILIQMDQNKIDIEEKKNEFLKSFINLIKLYIYKCNYIIKNENQKYVDPDTFKKIQYPVKHGEDNNDYYLLEFIKEINENYDLIKKKIDINSSIDEKDLCSILCTSLKNMFGEEKNIIQINYEDDYVVNEKKVIGENEDSEKEDENYTNDQFYYIVNIINKNKKMLQDIDNKEILEKLSNALSTDINNISIQNNNSIFVNNFIKSQKFAKLPPKDIRINYPNLPTLYDFKIIIDGLIRVKCKIPLEYFDYKYNFISPNLTLTNKRGSEKYDPPYGWLGIGLNVINKYDNGDNIWLNKDNDSWAIAYYGFGKKLTSEEIGNMLNDIIVKGVFKRELSIKCKEFDIRHKPKRIGVGIYLSPNVNIAAKNSGTFDFNKKNIKLF